MLIFSKTKCAGCSIRVYLSFSIWVATWNFFEGLPWTLPFYIAMFHFKYSYCNQLNMLCSILPLLCQHFALCFCLPNVPILNFASKIDASLYLYRYHNCGTTATFHYHINSYFVIIGLFDHKATCKYKYKECNNIVWV